MTGCPRVSLPSPRLVLPAGAGPSRLGADGRLGRVCPDRSPEVNARGGRCGAVVLSSEPAPGWRNRQTRRSQKPVLRKEGGGSIPPLGTSSLLTRHPGLSLNTEAGSGSDDPDLPCCHHNLAAVLRDLGDLTTATTHQRRALAIAERVMGPEHPDTATGLNNLARCSWPRANWPPPARWGSGRWPSGRRSSVLVIAARGGASTRWVPCSASEASWPPPGGSSNAPSPRWRAPWGPITRGQLRAGAR